MRKRDKTLLMVEANKRLEKSWLKEKHFITENNLDSLSKNDKVEDLAQSLASDPQKLKKAIGELESLGISKEDILKTAQAIKTGQSVGAIVNSAVSENLTEVEDLDDNYKTIPDKKDWIDRNFSMTGEGGLKDAISGAKIGGVLGAIGGIIVDDIVIHMGAQDPQSLLKTLLLVVGMAVATGGITSFLAGKGPNL